MLDAQSQVKWKSFYWRPHQSAFSEREIERKEIWRKTAISLPVTKEKRARNHQKRGENHEKRENSVRQRALVQRVGAAVEG